MVDYSRQIHTPFHIYADEQFYFLTAITTRNKKFFNTAEKLDLLKRVIIEKMVVFEGKLDAYVILPDHYHILFKIKSGNLLPKLVQQIHGKSSFLVKRIDPVHSETHIRIWQNYWDRCINTPKAWYFSLCYIIMNPVKHGYVREAKDWEYMSYDKWEGIENDYYFKEMLYRHHKVSLLPDDRFE